MRGMKKGVIAALVCCVLLFSGMASAKAKEEIVISGGDNALAGKFDPTMGYGVWSFDIFHCHLLKVGKENMLEKDLAVAERISPDGLTYTYEIRKDAKFADGRPLTARDVAFTFEKTKSQVSAADLTMLESVKVLDDYTVEFTLSKPWSLFPHIVTYIGIVPEHAYVENYGDKPLCSGAWRIVDFQKGQQLILEPNLYYYGPKSPFKRVSILKLDPDTALAAAQSGQLDFVSVESEFAMHEIEGMTVLALDVLNALAVNLPVIPETTGPDGKTVGNNVTCDIAVRKALNIGINRALLVEQALNGAGKPSYTIGDDVLPWTSRATFEDNRVEEAKKLLEDAGWKDADGDGVREKNGVKARFVVTGRSNDMARYNTVVALSQNAKALGIDIVVKSAPWSEARHARAVPTCWSIGYPSPSDFYLYYHSSQINRGAIGNPPSYSNKRVDESIDNALRATDLAEANAYWQEAEKLAREDVPFLYISRTRNVYFVRDGLRIPDLGKVPGRNQNGAGLENLNEWYWAD